MDTLTKELNKYAADLCDKFNAKNTEVQICFEEYFSCNSPGIRFKRLENETTTRRAHSGVFGVAFNTLEEGKIVVEDAFFLVANGFLKSEIAIPDEKIINRIIFFGELDCPLLTIEGNVLNTIVVLTGKTKKGVQICLEDICKVSGLSAKYVQESIQSLQKKGILKVVEDGNKKIYVPHKDAVRRLEHED